MKIRVNVIRLITYLAIGFGTIWLFGETIATLFSIVLFTMPFDALALRIA